MNYLPTCTSRLVVHHPCQVSFKTMQGCRMSWEEQAKMCKNSKCQGPLLCQICRTWIISPHATSKLVMQHPCQVSFQSMQRCRRSWKDKLKYVDIVAAFQGMHLSPAKHSYAWLPRKRDYHKSVTTRQTDRQTDRQTPDKVIPMCRYASQATQKF